LADDPIGDAVQDDLQLLIPITHRMASHLPRPPSDGRGAAHACAAGTGYNSTGHAAGLLAGEGG
jgi:hypothetical protein